MIKYLEKLNDIPSVKGTILSDKDGIIIESLMSSTLNKELIAAMAAKVALNIESNISSIDNVIASHCIIFTDSVNIFFSILGDLILIMVTDTDINIGFVKIEMNKTINQLKKEFS
ncbi:roadblock/LC7 domain-containing protein [candidate division WOR-3 bacterium]|jgi:predicted regulator of Ras-like GTPase activity (Roadblock/LC7/MglB family)|nr:roadblock/LC7 domain-containing protein [candidate division WOR-3 bacterium]